jgi:hypothetical protein
MFDRSPLAASPKLDSLNHSPTGGKDWFPKDTWLLVAEPQELSPAKFLKSVIDKVITLEGQLRVSVSNALRECVRACPDVSDAQKDLL